MPKFKIAGKCYKTGKPKVEIIVADNEELATIIFNSVHNANANIVEIVFESKNKELSLLISKYQKEKKNILRNSSFLMEDVRNSTIIEIQHLINAVRENVDNVDCYVDLYEKLLCCVLDFGYYNCYNNHQFDPSESTVDGRETFDFVVNFLLDWFEKFKHSYHNSLLRNIFREVESLVFIKGFSVEFHEKLIQRLVN
jgi:hypothetical protein